MLAKKGALCLKRRTGGHPARVAVIGIAERVDTGDLLT
jgi:hypothetical protein